jgi:iron complex outermembrane recepter protein
MFYTDKLLPVAGVIVLATQLPSPASAAEATATDAAQSSSGPQLEEIVITAQKRTEKLADVPVAASVVSTEALASMNAGDISDLNKLVPSVDLVGSFNGRVPYGIRGISSNANEATIGLASGVAIMLDGIPIPSDADMANQLEDIKDIEVLKGPQATLGGRTAAAGVINIVSRGPTDQLTGDASATATNDHEYRFNAFVGGPITESVLGSVSVYGNKRQFPINNIYTGSNSDQENSGIRGKLLIKPNDALDITLMADYQKSKSEGPNFVYTYVTPGAYLLLGTKPPPLPPPVLAALSQSAVLAGVTPSMTNNTADSVVTESANISDQMYSLNVDYRVGGLTLTSTTAFLHEHQFNYQDLFVNSSFYSNNFRDAFAAIIGPIPGSPGTWANFYNEQTQDIMVNQTSQEFRVASSPEEPFNYVVGLFYSDQTVDMVATRTLTPASVDYNADTDTKTYDVYARSTWRFLPSTSLVTGLRYNKDELSYTYEQLAYGNVATANSDNSNAVVGDISLQQKFSSNWMGYVTYARGYAPKVFNTGAYSGGNAAAPTAPLPATGQEKINHYEIGSKGTYLDNRLQVNAAAFYTEYKNYQIQTSESIPGEIGPIEGLTPAGKARTKGLELDGAFAATQELRIGADLAYIDARFVDYTGAPCWGNGVTQTPALGCHPVVVNGVATGGTAQNVSGDTMPDSPRFKGTVFAEQIVPWPMNNNYEGVIGGNYAYRSKTQFQPDQNPETIQGSFGLLDLSIGVRNKAGKWSVTAFCNNVTNHHYYVDMEDFWSGPWSSNAVVGQPARDFSRYVGIRLQAGL